MSDDMLSHALVQSIQDVFVSTLSTPCTVTDTGPAASDDQLICFIGLAGKLEGNLSLHLPQRAALSIVSKMLFTDMTEVNQDVRDGVGELVNMIAGGIKMRMQETPMKFDISLPTVIEGQGMHLSIKADSVRIAKRVQFDEHFFIADFIYKTNGVTP